MDKNLTEDKLFELIDQSKYRKINHRGFNFALLNNTHPFYKVNGSTWKILLLVGSKTKLG